MTKQIQIYIGLIMLAVFSWWLVQMEAPKVDKQTAAAPHSAEFFSNGYRKVAMDVDGEPKNELTASKMVHYGDDDTTELNDPEMTFFYPDSSSWVVKSESGWVSADGKDLHLQGKVEVDRRQAANGRPIHVKTSDLKVKPEINYAETDAWVEIVNPPDKTEGVGMQLYFSSPIHLKLLSNVRGRYEAN